jgi:hypothetical protein
MKKPQYLIEERSSGGHGDLYELEEERYFDVKDAKTGKVIMTFESQHSATYDAGTWGNWQHSGVSKVELTPDGKFVRVYTYDQPEPEIVALLK